MVERRELLSATTAVEFGPAAFDFLLVAKARWIAESEVGPTAGEWRVEGAHADEPALRPNGGFARGDFGQPAGDLPDDPFAANPGDGAAATIDDSGAPPSHGVHPEGGMIDIGGLGVVTESLSIAGAAAPTVESAASSVESAASARGGSLSTEAVGGAPLMFRAQGATVATEAGEASGGEGSYEASYDASYEAAAAEPVVRDRTPPDAAVQDAVSGTSTVQETAPAERTTHDPVSAEAAAQLAQPSEPATREAPGTQAVPADAADEPFASTSADNAVADAGQASHNEPPADSGDKAAESDAVEHDVESESEPESERRADSDETRLRAIAPSALARDDSEGGWIDLTCMVNDPIRFDPQSDAEEDASPALADARQPDQVALEDPSVAGSRGRSQVFELATARAEREAAAVADLPPLDRAPPAEVIRAVFPFEASGDAASAVRALLDEAAFVPPGPRDAIFAEMAEEPEEVAQPSPDEQTRWSPGAIVLLAPAVVVFDMAERIARRGDRRQFARLADWRCS
jgi:hypothetical protein